MMGLASQAGSYPSAQALPKTNSHRLASSPAPLAAPRAGGVLWVRTAAGCLAADTLAGLSSWYGDFIQGVPVRGWLSWLQQPDGQRSLRVQQKGTCIQP